MLTGLCAGTCYLTVTDADSCKATSYQTISEPDPLVINPVWILTPPSCYEGGNGAIEIITSGELSRIPTFGAIPPQPTISAICL